MWNPRRNEINYIPPERNSVECIPQINNMSCKKIRILVNSVDQNIVYIAGDFFQHVKWRESLGFLYNAATYLTWFVLDFTSTPFYFSSVAVFIYLLSLIFFITIYLICRRFVKNTYNHWSFKSFFFKVRKVWFCWIWKFCEQQIYHRITMNSVEPSGYWWNERLHAQTWWALKFIQ